MRIRSEFLAIALGGVAMTWMPSTAKADVASWHVLDQLRCDKVPNPTPTITYLAREQYLRLSNRIGMDSISCWSLEKPFVVDGLEFGAVCAAEEDGLLHDLYPDIYWRGPGTSPGTILSLQADAPISVVRSWAEENHINPDLVSESDMFDGMNAVECSSWVMR